MVLGVRAPHHRTEGRLGALPSSSARSLPWRSTGVGVWAGWPQCMVFSDALHFCWGVWGRCALTAEPRWQSIGQDTEPDPGHILALLGGQEMELFGHLC